MGQAIKGQLCSVYLHNGIPPRCPACGSLAVNKYGKFYSGKQRFICLMCGRQFLPGWERSIIAHRPLCPVCNQPMYRYLNHNNCARFRCSQYPHCRIYVKQERNSEEIPQKERWEMV
jgi:ssDNA-binding Zn-finger/Zn-ribbon topoisomerase 1